MAAVTTLALSALALVAGAAAHPAAPRLSGRPEVETKAMFVDHMVRFGKTYSSADELTQRYENFKASLKRADAKNEADPKAEFGVTKFSDLTPEEFKAQYLTARLPNPMPEAPVPLQAHLKRHQHHANRTLPLIRTLDGGVDWRSQTGVYIGPVRDQGQCGSCWAFSVSEQIASSWAVGGNSFTELAPQQLVDCDSTDMGCNGGEPSNAYQYVISAGGLEAESSYPYQAAQGSCQADPSQFVAKISGWSYVAQGGDGAQQAIQQGVQQVPLSVCVEADTWQDYTGGVLSSNCGQQIDHCVMLGGYAQGDQNYWIVRNSWGTDWGVQGYIYVQIDDQNLCGIENVVTVSSL